MKGSMTFKTITAFATVFFMSLLLCFPSRAQRNVTYEELADKNAQPPLFFDFFSLPAGEEDKVSFISTFSISYNYLPFKKLNSPKEDHQFFSSARLNMEVFVSDPSNIGKNDVDVEGLKPASRASWRDTAYAKTYDETSSSDRFLTGNITVTLSPGVYSYLLQMNRGDERDDRMSRTRTVRLSSYQKKKQGDILLAKQVRENESGRHLHLLNYGNRVVYGENYYAFAHIPEYDSESAYHLTVERIDPGSRDTTVVEQVFTRKLDRKDILEDIKPVLDRNTKGENRIRLAQPENGRGYSYALVEVPNKRFPNTIYRISVNREGSSTAAARRTVQSIWFNMPASLLNLDVSIDMLRFIADKQTIRELKSGSRSEKEQKFREFWSKKDPTPDTEFNELMAEYYRRIDYAYENYTTMNTVGYLSDRGEVYIKFGPPQNIQRKFPRDGATTEVWSYDSREFVFQATSGFGDFKLVSG